LTLWQNLPPSPSGPAHKGAFVFRSRDRRKWNTEGPFFSGWEVNHVAQDPREPERFYAAVNSAWFGPHIHASTDGGKTWKLAEAGLEVKSLPETSLKRVWRIEPGAADEPGVVYAGGEPAVLFRSGDWGQTWEEVTSLNNHSTRSLWTPGAGGLMGEVAVWAVPASAVPASRNPFEGRRRVRILLIPYVSPLSGRF
jgi:hypothetical protein